MEVVSGKTLSIWEAPWTSPRISPQKKTFHMTSAVS